MPNLNAIVNNQYRYMYNENIKLHEQWLYRLAANIMREKVELEMLGFFAFSKLDVSYTVWLNQFQHLNPNATVDDLSLKSLENSEIQSKSVLNLLVNGYILPINNGVVLMSDLTALTEVMFVNEQSPLYQKLKLIRHLMVTNQRAGKDNQPLKDLLAAADLKDFEDNQ